MPPKKQEASKKTVDKKKAKIVEDKTFGLKNKNKSKTVQKYIKGVESTVGKSQKGQKTYEEREKQKKEEEAKKLEESLFKPVIEQKKAPVGVDPKSVVCEFFRKGMCSKGDKCKYSHDLGVERKTAKIDIYTDRRDVEKKEDETMENWDQLKLETVVNTKHGSESKTNRTKIVCKYFLEAIEQKKYGWFWVCPNGGDNCMYVHALPPGFVLKTQKKEEEEETDVQPIEEIIEEARSKLATRTPLTLELFLKWREDKKKKKEEAEKAAREKKDTDVKTGRAMRSGRELFEFNADLFIDEEDVLDTEELEPEEKEEDEGPVRYIEATGTSINLTITNNGEEENDNSTQEVNEDLFTDENIPEDEE